MQTRTDIRRTPNAPRRRRHAARTAATAFLDDFVRPWPPKAEAA